jgi:hypothetical protein
MTAVTQRGACRDDFPSLSEAKEICMTPIWLQLLS